MPALYAHNQFGNRVLQKLDVKKRAFLLKNLRQFRIGLHGPDYLFFYKPLSPNPISQIGFQIHERPASEFMEYARKVIWENGTESPEYAYILGFICHFALDSECHPFVAEEMKRTGIGHVELESEFEKFLMRKNGEDPLSYPVGKTFPADKDTANCVAKFYEGVEPEEVYKALKSMRKYKSILVAPGKLKRTILDKGMKLVGQYDALQGHLFKVEDNPNCIESNEGLYERFKDAVPIAEYLIQKFDEYLEGSILDERFERDFE
ncbi:zinc dependent phospholipase C family protein [Faecalimonas sp.]